LVPLVLTPVNEIIAAPIDAEVPFRETVTASVLAPLVTNARQAWIRRANVLKVTPPGVPISVKVNPAPATLVTAGATSVPRPQSSPEAHIEVVNAM
jgi:hypothetical protein